MSPAKSSWLTLMTSRQLLVVFALLCSVYGCQAYVPQEIQARWRTEEYDVNQALATIEKCADRGENTDELYGAVRYIDRNAHKLYANPDLRKDLFDKAKGSWELRLAYEDSRNQYFYPYPDFRDFAMAVVTIEDSYFGKGIAQTRFFFCVAMGGPASFNEKTRQLCMNYENFYISGNAVPDWDLSYFMRGYERNWVSEKRKRPKLAFTLIGCTDHALVVRGSKTGGMAIFRRLQHDMRPAAYGSRGR
jgi:hypothetical protein